MLDAGLEPDEDRGRWPEDRCGERLLALAVRKSFRNGTGQLLEKCELLPHLKQRFSLIRCSRSEVPIGAYPRVPVSMSMASGCLG